MGTKVVNPITDICNKDILAFKRNISIKGKRISKVTSKLINLQVSWIGNEGQQGINRSKDLFSAWRRWITSGCNPELICPRHKRHSLLGHLREPMLTIGSIQDETEKVVVINLISTALRFHELYGPSPSTIEEKWKELRATITFHRDETPMRLALEEQADMSPRFTQSWELAEYSACRIIKRFLDNYDRFASKDANGARPIVCKHRISAKPDDVEVLVKNSPHLCADDDQKWSALVSVIGQPLDAHALSQPQSIKGKLPLPTGIRTCKFPNAYALVNRLGEELANVMAGSAITFNPDLPIGELPDTLQAHPGRIVPIEDKAGKVRPIATTCYSVNYVLAPIHRFLFAVLQQLPCDSTQQESGIQRMLDITRGAGYAISDDLTSATDLMPRYVQSKIIQVLLEHHTQCSKEQAATISSLWELLFANLRFLTPDGDYITYGRGQAMGCYTSWPAMALMNHFVVLSAAYSVYGNDYKQMNAFIRGGYIVCGDDIVIFNKAVALAYESIMESLGVKINKTKSFESNLEDGYSRAEFCKKLAVNGHIVSGVSPKAIFMAGTDKGIAFTPTAVELLKEINCGNLLSKRCLAGIASRYPKRLHHIPTEYGGLGFVNDVPKSKVLGEQGFIIVYHYMKLKSLLSYGLNRESFGVIPSDISDKFTSQLCLVDTLEEYIDRQATEFSSGKPPWLKLADRPPLSGSPMAIQQAKDILNLLTKWVYEDGAFRDASDNDTAFVADTLPGIYKQLYNNLFVGTPTKEQIVSARQLMQSKLALKAYKLLDRRTRQSNPLAITKGWREDDSDSLLVLSLAYSV